MNQIDRLRVLRQRLRLKRSWHIKRLIDESQEQTGRCQILDLGGEAAYWQLFDRDYLVSRGVKITLVNIGDWALDDSKDDLFDFMVRDACELGDIDAGSYDLVHSNSLIEHVGSWEKKNQLAEEIRRIGQRYYVQTPNFWFPIEPHYYAPFVHWLPTPVRIRMLERLDMGWVKRTNDYPKAIIWDEHNTLLNKRMMQCLFPDAQIVAERVLGLPKSYMAIKG